MSRAGSSRMKTNKDKQETNGHRKKKEELSSSDNDDDDGPIRAPLQLKIEFINSVMFRQWALAKKLCQFMLMYEPDNNEARQYAPLIDYMLAKEEAASSSSSSDDDSSDDDDSSGSGDSSSSSTSSNEDEEKPPNGNDDYEAPKPVNASLSNKCSHHK